MNDLYFLGENLRLAKKELESLEGDLHNLQRRCNHPEVEPRETETVCKNCKKVLWSGEKWPALGMLVGIATSCNLLERQILPLRARFKSLQDECPHWDSWKTPDGHEPGESFCSFCELDWYSVEKKRAAKTISV